MNNLVARNPNGTYIQADTRAEVIDSLLESSAIFTFSYVSALSFCQ